MTSLFHLFATRPVVDPTQEVRRAYEPMEGPEPRWLWWLHVVANFVAGVAICALPVCVLIWKGAL